MQLTFQTELRGISFRPKDVKEYIRTLATGDEVQLRRDSENKHDANAVAIDHNGTFLGFVHKDVAVDLAPLLDDEVEFRAYIHSWLSAQVPYVAIEQI